MTKVNLKEKLALFSDHWHPRIVGEINDMHVKLAKLQGEFVWHKHDDEDELFLVIGGSFQMHYEDRIEEIHEGEFTIVPKGVLHKPVATEEAHILLIEPKSTINTGDAKPNTLTQTKLDKL